mmetsp:Transcript_11518/g.13193  ORF Transcript_11518/g.13193 Transcript_11518/m.13193 type:complete len:94 (-) Transcript_11518:60-341(-)
MVFNSIAPKDAQIPPSVQPESRKFIDLLLELVSIKMMINSQNAKNQFSINISFGTFWGTGICKPGKIKYYSIPKKPKIPVIEKKLFKVFWSVF